MGIFKVDQKVFDVLPNYCLGVVIAKGIDNTVKNEVIQKRMEEEMDRFHQEYEGKNMRENESVNSYREAFRKNNMNPNKFMCSIEALSKRVQKGNKLPNINSIVDLGNVFSLKYVLPMGAHDIDKLNNQEMTIRFSTEEDTFMPLGEDKVENMPLGELVYVSGNTVKTRRWIWRQSDDGKITEETSYVLFPIDGFEGVNEKAVVEARDELAAFLKEQYDCEILTGYINAENGEVSF